MARVLLGGGPLRLGFAEGVSAREGYPPLEWLALGGRHIPVDEHVNALVPFRGPGGSFPYVSASDVLRGQADPNVLRHAAVILGTSAPGLMDLRSTPVQSVYPGVEIHANLLAGILDGHFKQQPAYTVGVNFSLLLVLGLLLSFGLPLLGPTWVALVTLGMLVAVGALNLFAWQYGDLVLPIAPALLMVFSLFVFNVAYGFFVESRSKRLIARRFGEYVPPELVSEMSKDPKRFTLEGESRQMTILFSDIRGFTTIAESLDPRELSQLMSDFLTPMTRVIHAHRGTIDKYMGDAIMAFWGAPLRDDDHSRHAVQAGLQMVEELRRLQPHFEERGWPTVRIGVGINTGMMSVGNMGSEFRMAYTVLGDAVNLGSRLEGLTRQYHVDIIVSETTRNSLPEHVFRQLDVVRVKGKLQPVAIFEPLGPAEAHEPQVLEDVALFHSALDSYRAREWDTADAMLAQLAARSPDYYPYRMYRERIAYFKHDPPPEGWDGVFVFKSK